jgi:hypothetical protein
MYRYPPQNPQYLVPFLGNILWEVAAYSSFFSLQVLYWILEETAHLSVLELLNRKKKLWADRHIKILSQAAHNLYTNRMKLKVLFHEIHAGM